jgi:ketosteroid isomerase-like protein
MTELANLGEIGPLLYTAEGLRGLSAGDEPIPDTVDGSVVIEVLDDWPGQKRRYFGHEGLRQWAADCLQVLDGGDIALDGVEAESSDVLIAVTRVGEGLPPVNLNCFRDGRLVYAKGFQRLDDARAAGREWIDTGGSAQLPGLVEHWFDAVVGNPETLRALADGSLELPEDWFDPEFSLDNLEEIPGHFEGSEGVRRWARESFAVMDDAFLELQEIVETGPDVVVITSLLRGRMKETGIEMAFPLHAVYRYRNGRILHTQGFSDLERARASARSLINERPAARTT